MAIFGAGQAQSQAPTRYIGIPIQTSIKGTTLPRGWGTFKAGCNLIDYLNFQSKAVTTTQSGGKGGGSAQTTSYTYSATILLGICQGPIDGIRTVWRDQVVFTNGSTTALAQAGLSLATGEIGQAPWGALPPPDNIGYSGLAYVYAQNYALNNSATIANHGFEVQAVGRQVVGSTTLDDANPADILTDFFATFPQWPTAGLGDLTDYGNYCLASSLLLSPYLDSQRQVSDFLTEILTASNSDCVWSDGKLKIIPYGDTTVTGNGVTWVPNLTPEYALTWDMFYGPDNDDPIKWDFKRPAEAYNYVQVEYLDRAAAYNTDVQPALDQANIDQFGLRKQDPTSLHSICSAATASAIAQLMVQRTCNVRRTATFELPELFGLLDPMDTLEIPLRNGSTRFVRITDYQENPDTASITYTVEEMLVGVGHAPEYSRQPSAGPVQNFGVDPGDAGEPAIFDVPVQLAQVIGLETWIGVSSVSGNKYWGGCQVMVATDGVNYVPTKTINGGSRIGVLTADLPVGSDPDTANTLAVDLSQCLGVLEGGTLDDANNGTTLCFVDGEYVSYEQATLTGSFQYNLGKSGSTPGLLRRGFWGSAIGFHPTGSLFVRLDDSVCKIPYNATDVGRTLYIKLLSFNVYGLALQQLADVPTYTHVIGGPPTIYAPESLTATPIIRGVQLNWINAPNVGIAAVEIWRSTTASFSGAVHIADTAAYATTYRDQDATSATTYWYWIRCRDIAGNVGAFDPSSSGAGVSTTTRQVQTADIGTHAVQTNNIDPSAIPAILLALSLTAVAVVTSNPPDDSLTGPVIFNSTNMQLYRWNSSTLQWILDVPAVAITGQLTDAQLAAIAATKVTGQLTDAQLAAIAAAKITGQLTDSQLAAIAAAKITGQITTTQITPGGITTPLLAAGAVTAATIAANTITAAQIAAATITATQIASGSITSAQIAASTIVAGNIAASTITGTQIAAHTIAAANITAGTITAGEIAAGTITATQLAAGSVTATQIAANAVTTGKLDVNAVTAGTIAVGAINASAIVVSNIIVTGHLVANAVTNAVVSVGSPTVIGSSYTTLTTVSTTLQGGDVLVSFTDYNTWAINGPRGFYQILNDVGTVVASVGYGGGSCPDFLIVAGSGLDTSGLSGSRTFYLQAIWQAGAQPTSQLPSLVITELKR